MKTNSLKPTIYDIAKLAGVSANTVSRVINDKPGAGPATRKRIKKIIEETGYHPNLGARSLRSSRKTGSIGVTLPAPPEVVPLSQDFFLLLFSDLYRVFASKGERICFDINPFATQPSIDYARSVWEKLFSACVIAGPPPINDKVIPRVHASGIPYLVLGRLDSFPDCSSATVDIELGTYIGIKHLIGRGHKKIAMLKAFSGYQAGIERRRGYTKALEEAGISVDDSLIRSVSFSSQSVSQTVHRLLIDPELTAIFDCSGMEYGDAIREGASRAGRVPGKDFDVVCFTYENNASVLDEACAHIWLPIREAAGEGVELLGQWFFEERDEPIKILYPPVLYEETTGEGKSGTTYLFERFE